MQTVSPHSSPSVQWQNLVFVSGQLPLSPTGPRTPSGSFSEQTRLALENVRPTKPARIVVPVAELHFGCLLEIDAIAYLPGAATK